MNDCNGSRIQYWMLIVVLSGEFGGVGMECFGFGFALGFTFVFQQSDFAFVERGYGVGGVEVLGLEVVGERKKVMTAKWDVGKGGRVAQKDGYALRFVAESRDGYKEFFFISHAEGATS
ncbi:hypothetical protein ACLOJK_035195 [Asimina triloba]